MKQIINFPNLGLHFENVGKKVTILGLDITYYGMLVGAMLLVGIVVTCYLAYKSRQDVEAYLSMAIWTIVFGMIGARLYYIIFGWSSFEGSFLRVLNIRSGGFSFAGALIAGIIVIVVYCNQHRMNVWKVLDTVVPGVLIAQIFGAVGEFFNREGFGNYTDGFFAMQLPIDAVKMTDVTDQMRQHIEKINGINMIQVSPVFFYEALWLTIILVALIVYMRKETYRGELFLLYVIGVGAGEFIFEGMRVSKLRFPLLHFPITQILALVAVAFAAVLLVYTYRTGTTKKKFIR